MAVEPMDVDTPTGSKRKGDHDPSEPRALRRIKVRFIPRWPLRFLRASIRIYISDSK